MTKPTEQFVSRITRISGGDATHHGYTADGRFVIRFNRAGKWFVYDAPVQLGNYGSRQRLTLLDAAMLLADGDHFEGQPGGQALDAKVRAIKATDAFAAAKGLA